MLIGQQQRQAVGHHDGGRKPRTGHHTGIGIEAVGHLGAQFKHVVAMHLPEENRSPADCLLQQRAVGCDPGRVITNMVTQIKTVPWRRRYAALAGCKNRRHMSRCGPVWLQPVRVQNGGLAQGWQAAQASLSGHADGWAFWKAGKAMQASNAAMVRLKPARSTLKRLALKICGTRHKSANVGLSP